MNTRSAKFWSVADHFRKTGPPWSPSTAGYEMWRAFESNGVRWSACMKVHAVPARSGPDAPVVFKASITLWPARAVRRAPKQAPVSAWFVAVREALERIGYHGAWMDSPDGVFGDFWKALAGPAAVRREAKQLVQLELPTRDTGPGASSGRGRSGRRASSSTR